MVFPTTQSDHFIQHIEFSVLTFWKCFYDDVMKVFSIAPPFFYFFSIVLGLVNQSSIRALDLSSPHTP